MWEWWWWHQGGIVIWAGRVSSPFDPRFRVHALCNCLHYYSSSSSLFYGIFRKNHHKRFVAAISIWQLLSWTHHMSAARAWKWKWSNGVEKSETDLFWCISMTNNVKSCKKINGRVQTFRFSVFTMGLCWKRPKNTKTSETKTQITQILKRYDLSRVVPCERARPEHSENVVVFEVSMF